MNENPSLSATRKTFAPIHLKELQAAYATGREPAEVIREIYSRIAERGNDAVWIYLPPLSELLEALPKDRSLPLFGVPFAVKDNIDVAGWPTTAACPEFRYTAAKDAAVVARLRRAGAIPIGKTNLDQFATGLVGTRSPYGIPRSIYDERYISGGSSSGSAVAVAAGLAAFSLGTDTAGSGRVPAAFNNLVGVKPTRGLLSTSGVVPACRSLDCVSIFTHSVADAHTVLRVAAGLDEDDAYSRPAPSAVPALRTPPRFGVPAADQLEFFGDAEAARLFQTAVERCETLGWTRVEIDFRPFLETAQLLYAGPFVAERTAAIQDFLTHHSASMDPVVGEIISGGVSKTAVEAFQGLYELERLKRLAAREWEKMDVLLLPTTGTTYTVEEILADPIRLNSHLGRYTNFVNLLDLCGIAIPAGFRPSNNLPFGITLFSPAFMDQAISQLGAQYLAEPDLPKSTAGLIEIAVVGAHLAGQPLNHQLTERRGVLLRSCRTSPHYRLYALANTTPPKPGLARRPEFAGPGIEVEVWGLAPAAFGDFVASIPPPMAIGTLDLEDGSKCKGFLCEPCALDGAEEITSFGGWRRFLASR